MKKIYTLTLFTLSALILSANNLQIQNVQIVSINVGNQFAMIEFDLSWDNSWHDATNWDAAWVFIKYRENTGSGNWLHTTLHYNDGTNDGHVSSAGAAINTPCDGKGVFIFSSDMGGGSNHFTGLQIRWEYGADGLENVNNVDLKVLAIEMVYVPQGSFYVGDGEMTPAQIYGNFEDGTSGNPLQIISEAALTLGGGGAGSLGNNDHLNTYDVPGSCSGCLAESRDDFDDANTQVLPANYPKGFNAFYCMKYEITQQQFTDMLNCATVTQLGVLAATNQFVGGHGTASGLRYGISNSGQPFTNAEPFAPMIYFDWIRVAAYADWAGLRPMTELEFEKAARGPNVPTPSDYPWGNADIDLSINLSVNNQGAENEAIASGYNNGGSSGNCWINGGAHSMGTIARGGIFAAHPSNSGQITSGGSFYGIMDLAGNCWERCVSVGESSARNFSGSHGDGLLNTNGYANQTNWPGSFGGIVNTNIGVGYRGGGLAFPPANVERNARISSRRCASSYYNVVIHDDGARLVRTAE